MTSSSERRLEPLHNYAKYRDVSDRTVRRWVGLGYFPGYRGKGLKGLIIDRDEADAALAQLPEGSIKPQGVYGPRADIRPLPGGDVAVSAPTPQQVAASLPPLTDEQATKIAAVLGLPHAEDDR